MPYLVPELLSQKQRWRGFSRGRGCADIHLLECSEEVEPMSPDTTEVVAMQELETMDIESLEEVS